MPFRFCDQLPTESAVLDIPDHIVCNFCRGKYTVAAFLDLTKTFDTLDRLVLICKLRC